MKMSVTLVVLCLLGSIASAQGRGGFFGGAGGVLGIAEVQKELGLNDDQKKQIEELIAKTREDVRGSGDFRGLRDLKEDERRAKFAELQKKGEELRQKLVGDARKILDAKQFERFTELRLQREGASALTTAEIADKLGLSQEQKEKLTKLQTESRSGSGPGNFGQLSQEERRAAFQKFRETRQKLDTDMLNVLNADQKTNWEKLQGKKFDFPQFRPGAGRTT